MVKIKSFFISPLWNKIFNKYNFIKVFIIFVVGFIFRISIAFIIDINSFLELINCISFVYYSFMAFFVILIHEIIAYFNFYISPKFIFNFFSNIPKIDFNYLKLSSIRNAVYCYFNSNKVSLTNFDYNVCSFNNYNKPYKINDKIVVFLMKNTINSNDSNHNSTNINLGSNDCRNNNDTQLSNTSRDFILSDYVEDGIVVGTSQTSNFYNSNNVRYPFFGNTSDISTFSEIETSSELETPRVSNINVNRVNPNNLNIPLNDSLNSSYTNDTNHGTVGSKDSNLPIIDSSLDGRRRKSDYNLFVNREVSDVDINYRRQQIRDCMVNHRKQIFENAMNDTVGDFTNTEIDVSKKGILGKVRLGLNYLGSKAQNEISKLDSVYVKYHDISKRHFYWTVWEKKRGTYISYNEFKKEWDSNTSIWREIKDKLGVNIKDKIDRLIHEKDPFNRRLNNRNLDRIVYESKFKRRR